MSGTKDLTISDFDKISPLILSRRLDVFKKLSKGLSFSDSPYPLPHILRLRGGGPTKKPRIEIDTSIPNVLELPSYDYSFLFHNKTYEEVIFTHPERSEEEQVMFMALWPPRGSVQDQPYNNRTSQSLIHNGNSHFLWNDFLPLAPTQSNDNLKQNQLHEMVKIRNPQMQPLLHNYLSRLVTFLQNEKEHGNYLPVIAWVGRTANEARVWLEENNSIACELSSDPLFEYKIQVKTYSFNKTFKFISINNCVHPSYWMKSKTTIEDRIQFSFTFQLVEGIRKLEVKDNIQSLVHSLPSFQQKSYEQYHKALHHLRETFDLDPIISTALSKLNYSFDDKIFDDHMILLKKLIQMIGIESFKKIITQGSTVIRLSDHDFIKKMIQWVDILGPALFSKIVCESFSCRLHDVNFLNNMHHWLNTLGAELFSKIICNSFCKRLNDEIFMNNMHYWLNTLGAELFSKIVCDSFCKRLNDETFMNNMHYWLNTLGAKLFSKII